MSTHALTILISVHNGAETLQKCLESIVNQSFQDFSVLAINDGSTDQTREILEAYQRQLGSERFAIISHGQKRGLTKSLGEGLAKIKTPYTARIDSDDWWEKSKLEKQMTFLESHPACGIIGTNYVNVLGNREFPVRLPESDASIRASILKRNPFAHSAVVFRTSLVQSIGGYDEEIKYGQDYDLWLRALPATSFHNIQEFLCYRTIGNGISVEQQRKQAWQGIRTQIKYVRRYDLPFRFYLPIFELFLVVITPSFLKNIIRRKSI